MRHRWHNIAPSTYTVNEAGAAVLQSIPLAGQIELAAKNNSGNDILLQAPAEVTYLSPLHPLANVAAVVSPVNNIKQLSAQPLSAQDIAVASVPAAPVVPSTSGVTQAFQDIASKVGLVSPAGTPVSKDTIIIFVASGIAVIGILALIFKS
jgi:hypothetical protein